VHWRFCLFACNDKFSFSVIKFGQDSRHGQGQGHDGGDSAQSTADLTAFVSRTCCNPLSNDAIKQKFCTTHVVMQQRVFRWPTACEVSL
jgi:hypothetical protein